MFSVPQFKLFFVDTNLLSTIVKVTITDTEKEIITNTNSTMLKFDVEYDACLPYYTHTRSLTCAWRQIHQYRRIGRCRVDDGEG